MKIAVTGANGFVGAELVRHLENDGHEVIPCVRIATATNTSVKYNAPELQVGDISECTDWTRALDGVNVIVHAAARVHVMHEQSKDPLHEFRLINVLGTANLARQAAAKGVERLIFISTAKIHGDSTDIGRPFRYDDPPNPADAYSQSKLEAEDLLKKLDLPFGMDLVIVRPPLVYGPGVKANFATMLNWLKRGLPLPLANATLNRRSLISLDNLVDFLAMCTQKERVPAAAYLVSDDEDLSTADLLTRLAIAMDIEPYLTPTPLWLLKCCATVTGRQSISKRLLGSLQVDISPTKERTGWRPPLTVSEGLKRAVQMEAP